MTLNVLVSGGGLDSAALVYASTLGLLGDMSRMSVLHIDYGQTAAPGELQAAYDISYHAARRLLPKYPVPKVHGLHVGSHTPKRYNPDSTLFGGAGDPFIRGRNLWLLMQAAGESIREHGTTEQIILHMGLCVESMMFADADAPFVAAADAMFAHAFGPVLNDSNTPLVRVQAPMLERGWLKQPLFTELWKQISFVSGGAVADEMLFKIPFTCWTPNSQGSECGKCYHCEKRDKLRQAILDDLKSKGVAV